MELDQSYVWITTRRLIAGHARGVQSGLATAGFPRGHASRLRVLLRRWNEVVGISIWDSPESRERFRLSGVEVERRQAMAPFVIEESSGFYIGRELKRRSR